MSSDNQTQPLHIDGGTREVKDEGLTDEDLQRIQRVYLKMKEEQEMWEPEHVHGPFTFLLNQNHNALRGCQSCGTTWIGLMAGTEDSLRWHEVQEPEEED